MGEVSAGELATFFLNFQKEGEIGMELTDVTDTRVGLGAGRP